MVEEIIEVKQRRLKGKIIFLIAGIVIIIGTIFMGLGFGKKNNYYKSENYYSLNKNVYVGGDAYNYVINANYFTGYICLGGTLYICSTLLICTGVLLNKMNSEKV